MASFLELVVRDGNLVKSCYKQKYEDAVENVHSHTYTTKQLPGMKDVPYQEIETSHICT